MENMTMICQKPLTQIKPNYNNVSHRKYQCHIFYPLWDSRDRFFSQLSFKNPGLLGAYPTQTVLRRT